jgi:GPH family glycoside/pentoside/hexuronide:cation symporter
LSAPVAAPAAGRDAPALSLRTCLAWGAGTIAVAALFNSLNVLLLRYVVDYGGIGAALAGTLIAGSKIYDAIIDPVIGSASDRSRSRHGRRRPFILAGGLLLAVSALLLFNLPDFSSGTATAVFFVFGLLVYATGYATFSVPYMAMPAEMTSSYHERSRLISFRVGAVAIASMLAVFVGPVLMDWAGGGQAGHTVLSIFLAGIVIIATLYCFHGTRDAPHHSAEGTPNLPWSRKLQLMAANRPFVILIIVKILQLMALAVTQASMPFLFKRVLQLGDSALGLYFLIFYGTMILVQPLWVRAARLKGKRDIFIAATLIYGLIYLSWYFVTENEPTALVYLRAMALGGFGGAVLLLGQSLLPDTMEWDYRQSGLRREGMLSAVYTIVEKVAFAFGAALTGLLLGRAGYLQGTGGAEVVQPASAIEAIYWLASIIPLGFLLLSVVALFFYDLTAEKLGETR